MSLVPLVYAAPNMISNTTSEDSFEKKHCENIYIHSKHLHTRHVRQATLVCFRDQTRLFDLLLLSQTDQHEGQERSLPSQTQGIAQPEYTASWDNPLKQSILAKDVDFKCMCNYTVFKRKDNKILSRQRFISGSVSIAPMLLPEPDGNLGKVVHPVLTPSRMERTHPVFQVHLFWWHAVSY